MGGGCEKAILHLDADAFFASVEQAADPRLRGRPVAVGGTKRGVVASASYEARRMGVRTAMPTAGARKLCPSLVVVEGDFEKYERFSRFVFSYAYDFTPVVEIASIDEGYADLSGQRVPAGRVAETIRRAVRETLRITLSGGVGTNKLVAAVASKLRKPDALVEVPRGTERAFLEPLDAGWLPGIGPKLAEALRRAGVARIGQIAELPPDRLALFVGSAAPGLHAMARGIDDRPVVPDPPEPRSLGLQETFDQDTTDEDFLRARLRRMADTLLQRLRAADHTARTVEVRIRYNDFVEARRSESLAEPGDLESDFYPLIDRLLRRAWQRRVSLRLVGLKFSGLYGALFQDTLRFDTDPGRGARSRLARAADRVREDFGPGAILRGHDLHLLARKAAAADPGAADRRYPRAVRKNVADSTFYSLNIKSWYSFLDALHSPEAAAGLAAARGCAVAAITDPNLHGAVEFARAAEAAGVRPVIAAEVRVGGRAMLAYVRDRRGYENLCALLSGPAPAVADTSGLLLYPPEIFPDVRYRDAADARMFDILQSVRAGALAGGRHPAKRRGSFGPRGAGDPAAAREAAARIAAECGFAFEPGGLHFPAYRPSDGSTPREFLGRLAREGLRARYGREVGTRHQGQLDEELRIIAEVGYEEYFLAVWDLLQDCRREGIDWITRGSAADSLVCYCLGISGVCPLRYGLYFKRFLNRDRMALRKLPDIDIDFAHDERDRVAAIAFEKYSDRAAVVGGFSTYRGRSAFADIAKAMGVSESQIRRYTRFVPPVSAGDLCEAVAAARECAGLDFAEEPFATALALAARLDGCPRHPKMHPCGIVLANRPIRTFTPTFTSNDGRPTTHFDMDAVEDAGLVKIDILAQGGLAVLRDTHAALRKAGKEPTGSSFDGSHLPPMETGVWEMIASGGARGVHHIESPAMTSLCRMVNVHTVDDLIAIVSVIRPGAANSMRKAEFARRAQGLDPVTYPHPSLEPVLRSTHGVVAYEEHVLQICEAFAGLPAGRADMLRRALVKDRMDLAAPLLAEFEQCAAGLGRPPGAIRAVRDLLAGFRGYAFCRAHSTAYAVEACHAAWLKFHHPAEFFAAVLTHGKGFYDRLAYSVECRRLGIGFLLPDINRPSETYEARTDSGGALIQVPVCQIKGLSETLLRRWRAGIPYRSVHDFHRRARPAADELDALARAGAFDGFGHTREELAWECRRIHAGCGAMPLFDHAGVGDPPAPCPPPALGLPERLRDEWELLGFPVSAHPLAIFPPVAWDTYCPLNDLMLHPGRRVTVAGMVVASRSHHQTDGRPMKFLTLCDPSGLAECEMFARAYARFGAETVRHPVLEITGVFRLFDNGNGGTLEVHSVKAARDSNGNRANPDIPACA